MLRIAVLLTCFGLAGCAHAPTCYKITSADTWVSGGPSGYGSSSRSHDWYGYLSDRTRTNGDSWNVESGINFHWDTTCEYEYEEYVEEEESPVTPVPNTTPVPGGSGGPR